MRRPFPLLSAACLLLLAAPAVAEEDAEEAPAAAEEKAEKPPAAAAEEAGAPAAAEEAEKPPAAAETPESASEEYERPGGYMVMQALFALDDFAHTGGLESGGSLGASGRLGYRLFPWLAVETQVEWVDRFTFKRNSVTVIKFEDAVVTTVNARIYPLTGQFQPFFLTGLGAAHFNAETVSVPSLHDDATDVAARFGAGIDLYGDKNWAITLSADYVLPMGDLDGLDYASFAWGFMVRF